MRVSANHTHSWFVVCTIFTIQSSQKVMIRWWWFRASDSSFAWLCCTIYIIFIYVCIIIITATIRERERHTQSASCTEQPGSAAEYRWWWWCDQLYRRLSHSVLPRHRSPYEPVWSSVPTCRSQSQPTTHHTYTYIHTVTNTDFTGPVGIMPQNPWHKWGKAIILSWYCFALATISTFLSNTKMAKTDVIRSIFPTWEIHQSSARIPTGEFTKTPRQLATETPLAFCTTPGPLNDIYHDELTQRQMFPKWAWSRSRDPINLCALNANSSKSFQRPCYHNLGASTRYHSTH